MKKAKARHAKNKSKRSKVNPNHLGLQMLDADTIAELKFEEIEHAFNFQTAIREQMASHNTLYDASRLFKREQRQAAELQCLAIEHLCDDLIEKMNKFLSDALDRARARKARKPSKRKAKKNKRAKK